MSRSLAVALSLAATVYGQGVGTNTAETHPALAHQICKAGGVCSNSPSKIVIDANWRWTHSKTGTTNCYTGASWDASLCPDNEQCASNCVLEGADYAATYGITTASNALTLKFVTQSAEKNIGSRVYLMEDDSAYKLFKLKNQEFTFDVDVSNLPCGLNGALYFSEMAADGGMSNEPTNAAGAKYGTGYCDAQCPHDVKFMNGKANVEGWKASSNDANAGSGALGACCSEMDIWEANSMATAFTPHPCSSVGLKACATPAECGDDDGTNRYNGICDKDGCDFNSYRMGNESFYGMGKTIDTKQPMTVVTQFLTADGTATGDLSEIKRFYVQAGKMVPNSMSTVSGLAQQANSITEGFCTAQKALFDNEDHFAKLGGLKAMGEAMDRGMVLVMSLWDDHAANALWLDSSYPTDADPAKLGVKRGDCATTSGVPAEVEAQSPDASVKFSNIKVGDIGSTFKAGNAQRFFA